MRPRAPIRRLDVTGTGTPSQSVFDWTSVAAGLSAADSSDGNVSLVFDLIESGYGAFDNLRVEASKTAVPEPGSLLLVGLGLAGLAGRRPRSLVPPPLRPPASRHPAATSSAAVSASSSGAVSDGVLGGAGSVRLERHV